MQEWTCYLSPKNGSILELVGKQVCDTCKTMRNIPPSTCDLDMINSKFVLARRLNKPKLFFRRAVYSSARNKRDPEELLRTMQWSGEVWVFWFEYSPEPLIANQDKNEWIVNPIELIHHFCLVWYSDMEWLSLDRAGIHNKVRTEPHLSLHDCIKSPQTLRWAFVKYEDDSPGPSCLCKFLKVYDIPHMTRSKPNENL